MKVPCGQNMLNLRESTDKAVIRAVTCEVVLKTVLVRARPHGTMLEYATTTSPGLVVLKLAIRLFVQFRKHERNQTVRSLHNHSLHSLS
jgi:hypothetical protein